MVQLLHGLLYRITLVHRAEGSTCVSKGPQAVKDDLRDLRSQEWLQVFIRCMLILQKTAEEELQFKSSFVYYKSIRVLLQVFAKHCLLHTLCVLTAYALCYSVQRLKFSH
jgi:hypothetical protein